MKLVKSLQALIDQETAEIKQVFNDIKTAVQNAEDEALRPLEDRRKRVEQEEEKLRTDLQRNIATLSKDISDLQTVRDEEDPISFLQVSNQSRVLILSHITELCPCIETTIIRQVISCYWIL